MSISDRLDQIAARCNAATDGPWAIWHSGTDYPQSVVANDDGLSLVAETFTSPKYPAADAEFIAHARTDVPWLIEQVRKRDAALRAVLELHVSQFDRTVDHDGRAGHLLRYVQRGAVALPDGPRCAGRSRGGIVMCQTMWRCPDCGEQMLAREQWDHQCGEET